MSRQHQEWIEDIVIRLLCVFALDRFGDFVSDEVFFFSRVNVTRYADSLDSLFICVMEKNIQSYLHVCALGIFTCSMSCPFG